MDPREVTTMRWLPFFTLCLIAMACSSASAGGDSSRQDPPDWSEECRIIPFAGEPLKSDIVIDLRGGAECRFTIHPTLPVFAFRLVADAAANWITRIDVLTNNRRIASFTAEGEKPGEVKQPPFRGAEYFIAEDLDFDGYKDIRILASWGVTGNRWYRCWLFDPKANVFVKSDALSELCNVSVDSANKTISDSYGAGGKEYATSIYQFDAERRLIVIRRESQEWDGSLQCYVKTVQKRRDGKLVVVGTDYVRRR